MADEATNRRAFRIQRYYCARMGAPITACVAGALADGLARDSATGTRALDWPGDPTADALPLRLIGGLHALVLGGVGGDLARVFAGEITDRATVLRVLASTLVVQDADLLPWLDGPPQTNEPGRAGVLMLGLMAVARRFALPLDVLEIGSSAGLNLLIDRYRFDLGGIPLGPDDAPVTIMPEWRGARPSPTDVHVARVRGVDIAPIDATDPAAAARLRAYVWADNPARLDRLTRAIAMLRDAPVALEAGDAADWLAVRLAEPPLDGAARVVMHSVVWQYLGAERQARITAAMERAGAAATATRPLAWVRMEPDRDLARQELWVRAWPGGTDEKLAHAQAHGAWVEPMA